MQIVLAIVRVELVRLAIEVMDHGTLDTVRCAPYRFAEIWVRHRGVERSFWEVLHEVVAGDTELLDRGPTWEEGER